MLDSSTSHSSNETSAELNPSPIQLWLPVRHSAKLPPNPTRDNLSGHQRVPAKRTRTMAYVISCDCGYVSRGETEDELVEEANRHIEEVHPDMAGKVSRDDMLAMAEEV